MVKPPKILGLQFSVALGPDRQSQSAMRSHERPLTMGQTVINEPGLVPLNHHALCSSVFSPDGANKVCLFTLVIQVSPRKKDDLSQTVADGQLRGWGELPCPTNTQTPRKLGCIEVE